MLANITKVISCRDTTDTCRSIRHYCRGAADAHCAWGIEVHGTYKTGAVSVVRVLTACRRPCVVGGTTCSAVYTSSVSCRTYSMTRSLSGGVLTRGRLPSTPSSSSESLRSLYGDSPPTSRYLKIHSSKIYESKNINSKYTYDFIK